MYIYTSILIKACEVIGNVVIAYNLASDLDNFLYGTILVFFFCFCFLLKILQLYATTH